MEKRYRNKIIIIIIVKKKEKEEAPVKFDIDMRFLVNVSRCVMKQLRVVVNNSGQFSTTPYLYFLVVFRLC